MARNPVSAPGPTQIKDDWISNIFEWAGGKVLMVGIVLSLISTGILIYLTYYFGNNFVTSSPQDPAGVQALRDAATMHSWGQIGLLIGLTLFAVGMALMFWGDIALPLTLLIVATLFFTSNWWIDWVIGYRETSPESYAVLNRALWSLKLGGLLLGIIAIVLQVADIAVRIRNRTLFGAKDTLMKYGSGIREDYDYKNVFMGKCWQLPFCRKFVREKCPIYHARRCCWRERVGCMCEEEVIQGAMTGNVIPKDSVAAAKYIPYNKMLTPAQKAERCRQCVIYNEHQRQKYKLMTYVVPLGVLAFYGMFRQPLLMWTMGLVGDFDKMMSRFTFSTEGTEPVAETIVGAGPGMLEEFVLIGIMLFVFAQLMKIVEFCIFKLKI
jgi:hypothetical protein